MSGNIITNHDVLLPEYLPAKLLFREDEYQHLLTSVKNRVGTLIVGPVGSGKTSLVRMLQRDIGSDNFAYVDCLVHDTGYAVLKEIVPGVKSAFLRSTFELIEELRRISNGMKMVCFDNFVRLKDLDVIDKVVALGMTIILVASVERDMHLLGPNSSPKMARIIKLENYITQEAYRILKRRAEQGLTEKSYDDAILKTIIDSTDGNITLGLNVLRAAALKAETDRRSKIALDDLRDLLPMSRQDIELTEDERAIMKILREKRSVEHKQLYNFYCQSATSPKQERTFRNYLQRLIAKSLVKVDYSNSLKTYQVIEHG